MRTKFITPKVITFKKKTTSLKSKNELIILSHNICVDGLSMQRAEENIARYRKNIAKHIELESCIKDYTIQHYLTITSFERQGIELIYPSAKEDLDKSSKKTGYITESFLNRISKIYDIFK